MMERKQASVSDIKIGDSCDNRVPPSHLGDKSYQKIVKLIGEKCLIACLLQGTSIQALLDTGA